MTKDASFCNENPTKLTTSPAVHETKISHQGKRFSYHQF